MSSVSVANRDSTCWSKTVVCALFAAALLAGCSSDESSGDESNGMDVGEEPADTGDVLGGDAREQEDGDEGGDDAGGDDAGGADAREDAGDSRIPLTSYDSWQTISADGDPLPDHRPDTVECPDDSYATEKLNEDQTLTIDTGNCNYFAGRQQILGPIEAGDQLRARIWHFELTANEPATAHAALLIDGNIVWEENVDIPAESNLYAPEWTAESSYPEGTPVVFHLHNHGSNSWNFIELVKQ
jgi:hypothetical protein